MADDDLVIPRAVLAEERRSVGKGAIPARPQPRGVYRDDGTIMMVRPAVVVGGMHAVKSPPPPTLPPSAGGSGAAVPALGTAVPMSVTQALLAGVAPDRATIAAAVANEEPGFAHLKVEMMCQSLALFALEVLQAPQTGGPFLIGRHHEAWSDLVNQHDRIGIMAPRDHSKSAFWSFAYILWRAYFWPRNELYLFSKTQEQANKLLGYIRDEMESNPRLAHLLPPPGERDNWTRGAIKLANGFLIVGKGYGVSVRGAHPRFIVCDDVLSDDDAYSEITRIKTVAYFQSAITNMVIPGGQIVVVGTPLHLLDLFAWLKKNPVYRFVSFPAIEKDENGKERALWDTRYTLDDLARRRAEIGEVAFTREFLLVPIADSLSLFPSHLFQGPDVQVEEFAMRPTLWLIKTMSLRVFFGIDFAMSAATGADYTCIFVVGVDPNGNRWVLDIIRVKGLGFQDQIALIKEAANRYGPTLIFSEANQMQRIFSDELIRTTDLPIRPFVTGRQKNQIELGVPSLRILLENRKYRIPRGDEYSRRQSDVWMTEMQAFGWLDGKLQGVGEHDDTVMACIGPGALVTTRSGKKPIELVRKGAWVLTHLGRWRRVVATMRRRYTGAAYVGRVAGAPEPLLVTSEHPVWSAKPRRDAAVNNSRLLVDEASWAFREAHTVRAGRRMAGDFGLLPTPRWPVAPARVDLAEFVSFARHPRGGNCWKKDATAIWWRRDRRVPRHLAIDEQIAFLLGIYVAEGSTTTHQVSFGLHKRESYIERFIFREATRRFAALHGSNVVDNSRHCWFSSVPARNWFAQIGMGPKKCLPMAWMGWPLNLRMQVARGWLVGDGAINKRPASGHTLHGVTIARGWLDQVVWTLREAGYCPTVCRFKQPSENSNPAWELSLNAADSARLLAKMNPIEEKRWASFRPTRRTSPTNRRSWAHANGVVSRFAQWDEVEYDGLVYNLQVEDDESYVVDDFAVHNCWICDEAVRAGGFNFTFGEEDDMKQSTLEQDILAEELEAEMVDLRNEATVRRLAQIALGAMPPDGTAAYREYAHARKLLGITKPNIGDSSTWDPAKNLPQAVVDLIEGTARRLKPRAQATLHDGANRPTLPREGDTLFDLDGGLLGAPPPDFFEN